MHRTNSEERLGISSSISYEVAAKLKFYLAIDDYIVLGLRDILAKTN